MTNSRSYADEKIIHSILYYSKENNLYIFDCRPIFNAIGNQIKGQGVENIQNYDNCFLNFLGIENIHKVSNSFKSFFLF
jgi:hypothetical protein